MRREATRVAAVVVARTPPQQQAGESPGRCATATGEEGLYYGRPTGQMSFPACIRSVCMLQRAASLHWLQTRDCPFPIGCGTSARHQVVMATIGLVVLDIVDIDIGLGRFTVPPHSYEHLND